MEGQGTGWAGNAQHQGKLRELPDQAPGTAATVTPPKGSPTSRILEFYRSEQRSPGWEHMGAPGAKGPLILDESVGVWLTPPVNQTSILLDASASPLTVRITVQGTSFLFLFVLGLFFLFVVVVLCCFGGCTPGIGNRLWQKCYAGAGPPRVRTWREWRQGRRSSRWAGERGAMAGSLLSC